MRRLFGRRRARSTRWGFVAAAPGLIATALLVTLQIAHVPALDQLGLLTFDAYQRAAPRPYQPVPVRVVDIDDESIARLGQWPWPRTELARLTRTLGDAGAASIAYDVVFSEPDRTSPARVAAMLRGNPDAKGDYADVAALADHDVLLGEAIARTPTVAGFFLTHEANRARPGHSSGFAVSGASPLASLPAFRGAITALPVIAHDAAGEGFVSFAGDGDGVVRATPLLSRLDDQIVPSLSLEALRVAQGAGAVVIKSSNGSGEIGGGDIGVVGLKVGDFQVPTTRSGELWMYYHAPVAGRTVPAWKVLTGALSPAEMKRLFGGCIVFVGTGASGLRDLVATPLSSRELGVEVHAQAVEQMILGRFLVRPDWAPGLEGAVLLLLGVGLSVLSPGLGALRGGVLAAAALGAVVAGSWFAFRNLGLLVDPTLPALGVVGVYTAGATSAFYREERSRGYIRSAFNRYLSPEMVERIARDPSQLELGGEERDLTVMFGDIRGFTRTAEALTPPQVIALLVEVLTPLTDILLARKATIDKFMGDAILAFWNAPLDDPDQHRNAALSALGMVERLKALNLAKQQTPGGAWPKDAIELGIGMECGPCCVGNIGSRQRLSYSLIGDTVNLASRLQGLSKFYDVAIVVGDSLAGKLGDFALLELDLVRVLGRETPERAFALLGPPGTCADAEFQQIKALGGEMLAAYRSQDWDQADAARRALTPFAEPFGLQPFLDLYAERIAACRLTPPPPEWDGAYQATEK